MDSRIPLLIALFFASCFLPFLVTAKTTTIKKNTIKLLREQLLFDYDSLARPVTNYTKTTIVQMAYYPVHITELNEEQGILTVEGFLDMVWKDEHLIWDPQKFEGIKKVHFTQEEIWKPDISVFEGRGSEIDPLNDKVHVYTNYTGHVSWTSPATIQSVCELHYNDYPYDSQKCIITFGSWVQDGKFVDLLFMNELDDLNIDDSHPTNPLWKLQKVTMNRKEETYPTAEGNEDKYIALVYVLHMERRIALSQRVSIIPKIVASLLHLSMFCLPANSEKKLILGTSAILLQTITVMYIGVSLPTAAAGPFAMFSARGELSAGIAAIVLQVIILNLSLIKTFPPPTVIKRLNSGIVAHILCLCTVGVTAQNGDTTELVDGSDKNVETEWYLMATLLDRLLFPIFAVVFIIEGSM